MEVGKLQSASLINSEDHEAFKTLSERTRVLEYGTRAKNLRITGVEKTSAENPEKTHAKGQKLIFEKLKLPQIKVQSAYRIGRTTDNNAPRPIIAKISSVPDKITSSTLHLL